MASLEQYKAWSRLPQVKAALDTIAWAEGANYNTIYGGGTFSGNQHPNRAVTAAGYTSTAAGRYQFLIGTWRGLQRDVGFTDFSPASQDAAAVRLIEERGELSKLLAGDFEGMLRGLGCLWASLPFSGCGQNERSLTSVMNYFRSALAALGGTSNVPLPASSSGSEKMILYGLGFVLFYLLISD